ncbi:recombinase family protein, partial [Streptococcus pseudopneumoniae]|nr:recombinase family protein [Streptococcus pseudopneumoniae]
MDRIARSLLDLIGRMKQIEGVGAQFRSLTEQIDTRT